MSTGDEGMPIRHRVAQLWSDVLGQEVRSGQDEFHDLGGTSLKALRLCARLSEGLDCKVPVRTLLEHSVFDDFVTAVEQIAEPEIEVAPVPVVCFPFAGGGASFFRAWTALPSPGVRVVAVQLPGREEIFGQPLHAQVVKAVPDLIDRLRACVAGEPGFALFGHSLGAVLAYEVACELQASGDPAPQHLFVSGSPGPWSVARTDRASDLADEDFLVRVSQLAGFHHEALDDPDLREVLLPRLRADVAMHEDYVALHNDPLDIPVTSLRGSEDRLVSAGQAREWESVTNAGFGYREVPGGHMYLVDNPTAVLQSIAEVLHPRTA